MLGGVGVGSGRGASVSEKNIRNTSVFVFFPISYLVWGKRRSESEPTLKTSIRNTTWSGVMLCTKSLSEKNNQESPWQTKERAKTKSSRISPIFVNSGVFPEETSTIHIELLFRNAL